MFERLDDIQWEQLKHAYGSASDVPQQIRDLMSNNMDIRKKAFGDLTYNIWHQGTVFEATPYAVPFLAEVLEAPNAQDKDKILRYLARLAQGNSFIDIHQHYGFAYSEEQRTSEEFKGQLSAEMRWVFDTYAAVLKHYSLYIIFLDSDEPQTRNRAAELLNLLPEKHAETLPLLQKTLKTETDIATQVTLIKTIAPLAATHDPSVLKDLEPYMEEGYNLIIRLTTAQILARILKDQTTESMLAVMRIGLTQSESLPQYHRLTQCEYDLPVEIAQTLYEVGRPLADPLLVLYLDYMKNVKWEDMTDALEALLAVLFNNQPLSEGITRSDLDAMQQQALKIVADHVLNVTGLNGRKVEDGEEGEMLRHYGLPSTADSMRDFLKN